MCAARVVARRSWRSPTLECNRNIAVFVAGCSNDEVRWVRNVWIFEKVCWFVSLSEVGEERIAASLDVDESSLHVVLCHDPLGRYHQPKATPFCPGNHRKQASSNLIRSKGLIEDI